MSTKSLALLLALIWLASPASALDYVSFSRAGRPFHVAGKVLVEAADGGLLVLDREGILWAIQPSELTRHTTDPTPYRPMEADELQKRLLEELPDFRVHATSHYLVCYNTSPAYAQWCGALYERLYWSFHNYWQRRGLKLHAPATPLVALVFATKEGYQRHVRAELGDATEAIIGFYSPHTNRVTMYDLTGTRGLRRSATRLTTSAQINRLLMQPGARRMVATIIHEATHQIAYNCGLHQRYADIPLWVSEGLAVYFETPDLRSKQGWRNIGGVNRTRLDRFRRYLPSRPADSLQTLISTDNRFRKVDTALDAYAEAWALNYYLIHRRVKDYVPYLRRLAQKPPLVYDTPSERVEAFTKAFGTNWQALDTDFLRYMATVR